jgi:hypothetical protein
MAPAILSIAKDYEVLIDSFTCGLSLDLTLVVKFRPAIHQTVTNHYQELIRKDYVKRCSIEGGELVSIALAPDSAVLIK